MINSIPIWRPRRCWTASSAPIANVRAMQSIIYYRNGVFLIHRSLVFHWSGLLQTLYKQSAGQAFPPLVRGLASFKAPIESTAALGVTQPHKHTSSVLVSRSNAQLQGVCFACVPHVRVYLRVVRHTVAVQKLILGGAQVEWVQRHSPWHNILSFFRQLIYQCFCVIADKCCTKLLLHQLCM